MEKKNRFVKTKIVATIGPASESKYTLERLIKNGMSVARLNFSHGSYEHHLEVIENIRQISQEEDIPVAILQDLCGPKIRLGALPGPVKLKKNQVLKLSIERDTDALLFTDFKELVDVVKKGDPLLIDDGYIELTVTGVFPKYLLCKVKVPGIASSKKGINLPQCTTPIPVFTEKDKLDLEFGLKNGVDFVAMSFVDSPSNIIPVKEMMKRFSREIPVIAKIERPVALKNIDEIMDAFDGIMVARGDLGVEVPPEEVPIIQKKLIHLANIKNKWVITATQMLESMINNPRPTRAEASDVSNAILDGTDAVMLSGETAVGKYPVEAVTMMRRIAQTTEESELYCHTMDIQKESIDHTDAITRSAAHIAEDLNADYIIVFSFSGHTALKLSKYRPVCPALGISSQKEVVTRMAAYWGICPHYVEYTRNTDDMIRFADEVLESKKQVKPGDLIITISGNAPMKGATNLLKISRFGEPFDEPVVVD